MFKKAQVTLTIVYSLLFLVVFWLSSLGIYEWMNTSFGEGYISQVQQRQGIDTDVSKLTNAKVVTIAGDVALDQLRNILLLLNGGFLFIIPVSSWFLVKRTLAPVKIIHERQRQFVSDASHEMRTPLAIISGEIEVTLNKKRNTTEYKNTLVSTKEEADRLSKLVENLLFLAKDDQITNSLPFETVDITDIVSDVSQALQPKSKQKKLSVILTSEDVKNAPIVKGYPTLLRQLFYNLLDNAIIYTKNNGKIVISFSETKHAVLVAIKDTGIGIAKEDQNKIMNRFYRADTSRSTTKGYGLGLSIVKSIVKRHGGQIAISSESNKGSTFIVTLPKF